MLFHTNDKALRTYMTVLSLAMADYSSQDFLECCHENIHPFAPANGSRVYARCRGRILKTRTSNIVRSKILKLARIDCRNNHKQEINMYTKLTHTRP